MKIIAIDSSGLTASVAIVEDETVIAEYTVNHKKTHSTTLLPMLNEIKKMTDTNLNSVDAIAIAKGPGSFTGLRIGSATAKGLGLALNKPIVPVPTVDAMACNAYGYRGIVCPVMDARREQVYTGVYCFKEGKKDPEILLKQAAMDIVDLCNRLEEIAGSKNVLFLGDGVPVYGEKIKKLLNDRGVRCDFAPVHMSRQRAAALAFLGEIYLKKGIFESAAEHKPEYLRMSQAERERLQKDSI
ncbi:MAG: tRNA (adenosine(37)-N6)-threonylcarbamoyltransferase complex dimerization subunit type 1 TsaB [Lachnospiraceae bacterium]|nr:tRNA (adenosine(37)-N6)-threonylcarbamoyltransferase complex dimerization subunit type 1 TsaB [Lachnospiraceae bacterium]